MTQMKNRLVLVAGTKPTVSHHLTELLGEWGYEPVAADSVDGALAEMGQRRFLLSLLDLGGQTNDLLRRLKTQGGVPGTIILLADADAGDLAAEAAALGADDFLQKPFSSEDLENVIKSALARPRRNWERTPDDEARARLRAEVGLWCSPKMSEVREIIEQAARVDVTVLVAGETGTGKELVARAIHDESARHERPVRARQLRRGPGEPARERALRARARRLHRRAPSARRGRFEAADGGTLFLDEIGELPLGAAGEAAARAPGRRVRARGRHAPAVKVDVRVVAATQPRPASRRWRAGRFREDLYYRLNVIPIMVPPLRERPEEIPVLADYFMHRYSQLFRRETLQMPAETMQRLVRHASRATCASSRT